MPRIPDWLEQVAHGLSDGRTWLIRSVRDLPALVRLTGWIGFQAILFKIQPQLWHVLLEVAELVVSLFSVQLHVQLLLLVIALLTAQMLLTENRFKRIRNIVENMDSSQKREERIASDGGTRVEIDTASDERRRWWICVICGAITGGEIGLFWGPAGVIGLAVLGAMLGDEWVRSTGGERAQ